MKGFNSCSLGHLGQKCLTSTSSWCPFLGYCGSLGGGDPANLHPAFRELAEFTSGQAILLKDHWELEQLNDLTGGVMEGTNVVSIGSNASNRKKRRAGADSRYSIPVDDSMEKMTVTVTTTRRETKGLCFFQSRDEKKENTIKERYIL